MCNFGFEQRGMNNIAVIERESELYNRLYKGKVNDIAVIERESELYSRL